MDDADDFDAVVGQSDRRLRQPRHAHHAADRVGALQPRAREGLVDERNLSPRLDLLRGEQPAFDERDPERFRVVSADLMPDDRLVVRRRAWHLDVPPEVAERMGVRVDRRRRDAGHACDTRQQFLEEECTRRATSGYLRSGSGTLSVSTRSAWKPSPTRPTASTVLIIRLAPTISMIDSATAPTTKLRRSSACAVPPVTLRPLLRSGFIKSPTV